jgi:hypothetical protein
MPSHNQESSSQSFYCPYDKRQTFMMHFPGIYCGEKRRLHVYETRHILSLNQDVIKEHYFLSKMLQVVWLSLSDVGHGFMNYFVHL